jgi:hypothetical protein
MGRMSIGARKTTAPLPELATGAAVQSLFSRRAHQRDCVSMPHEFRQLRVIPKPQREHVAVASDDDGFPPAVFQGFLGDDEMTGRDLVPGPG